ncbi:MAG: radical SAM protein [Opitutus sp.]|nr:radical SAM protein [Opitutus sp.]
MLISEIFYSLQGEGELTGVPSVFVRTSGCNLRCNWCDTPYASWNPEGEQFEVPEIVARVQTHGAAKHVVLTGGEPMIAPQIHELAFQLKEGGYHLTIETAATVPPRGIACDLASLSPKLAHSAPDARLDDIWRAKHEALRRQPAVIAEWIAWCADYQLKFVVSSEADVAEIETLLRETECAVPPHKILLMPEGTTLETLRARAAWLSELCKARGFRYAHRLHVELYGNKRGT